MSVVRRSCAPPDAREDEAPGRPNEDWEDDAGEGVRGGLNSVCEALLADAGERVGGVDCVWGEAEEPFHTWPLSFAGHVFSPSHCIPSWRTSMQFVSTLRTLRASGRPRMPPYPHLELVGDLALPLVVPIHLNLVPLGHVESHPRAQFGVGCTGPDGRLEDGKVDVACVFRLDAREEDPVGGVQGRGGCECVRVQLGTADEEGVAQCRRGEVLEDRDGRGKGRRERGEWRIGSVRKSHLREFGTQDRCSTRDSQIVIRLS